MKRRTQRGFTLIELMIVVSIIGILSSVAIPVMQQLTLRSKSAERLEVTNRIKKGVADYYLQHGTTLLPDNSILEGDPQPSVPPGSSKRMPNWRVPGDGWVEIFRWSEEIMGALYYQYSFTTDEAALPYPTLTITSTGDLDGDNMNNTWITRYSRVNGAYVVIDPAVDELHPENTW